MGAFSIWHWLAVVLIVAIPVIVIAIVLLVRRAAHSSRRSNASARPVASRLAELEALRERGSVSDAEAAAERARILRDL